MNYFTTNLNWLMLIAAISVLLCILYFYFDLRKSIAKANLEYEQKRYRLLKHKIVKINRILLETGMNSNQIMVFWQDCIKAAEIQTELSPCSCKDVNECETWCQSKALFKLNPPKD